MTGFRTLDIGEKQERLNKMAAVSAQPKLTFDVLNYERTKLR